jgi:hypothetical protein
MVRIMIEDKRITDITVKAFKYLKGETVADKRKLPSGRRIVLQGIVASSCITDNDIEDAKKPWT